MLRLTLVSLIICGRMEIFMGLSSSSVGTGAIDRGMEIKKRSPNDKIIALAGNPNVGKSTVFNALTGMNQHTGNWPGKTVANAQGYCSTDNNSYILVDLPGTYSLMAHSAEEEVARDFICFGSPDATVIVCDATCLERNLNLVLQTLETGGKAVVCVNLMDEAKRKGVTVDLEKLSQRLGVPVVGVTARKKRTLKELTDTLDRLVSGEIDLKPLKVRYVPELEQAINMVEPSVKAVCGDIDSRWLSLRLIEGDQTVISNVSMQIGKDITADSEVTKALSVAVGFLKAQNIDIDSLKDIIVSSIVSCAEKICDATVIYTHEKYSAFDRRLDRLLTGRAVGYPVMLLLLALIFWLTVTGANYPSQLLSDMLFAIEDKLHELFRAIGAPEWLRGLLVSGMYHVLAWVVSVMLPPMAIFFPLFTLLEDVGYLPRVAYNLDSPFRKCNACGKQALTMCMGFGCNAAGVVGCRIIDSPRERLLATVTNSFVPCNGRFPTIVSIITMFFIATASGAFSSVLSSVILTAVILLGILATFAATKLLSATVLKGTPSSFALELPPYRRPQIGKVLVRSVFDRTIFVLGRAASVAAPAGMLIWLMANISVGGVSLLAHCSSFLDPFGRFIGLDGVILMAFILGFPANEIVVPIIIMAYTAEEGLVGYDSLLQLKELLVANGWTTVTAVCVVVFSLMHWPCSTTLLTVKKETGSFKWTAVAALLPTAFGILLCALISSIARLVS